MQLCYNKDFAASLLVFDCCFFLVRLIPVANGLVGQNKTSPLGPRECVAQFPELFVSNGSKISLCYNLRLKI